MSWPPPPSPRELPPPRVAWSSPHFRIVRTWQTWRTMSQAEIRYSSFSLEGREIDAMGGACWLPVRLTADGFPGRLSLADLVEDIADIALAEAMP